MAAESLPDTDRRRLFLGACLALIPTGASFSLVSNIIGQLKQEFLLTNFQVGLIAGAALWGMAISLLVVGPLLEALGLKNGARLAFLGHVAGITTMILASLRVGEPSAFWMLMVGATTLAAGNGMIEVTGNPLVAALYPDEKTKRLNWFHAFFPIGLILGGLIGFALATYGGRFSRWNWQLATIYLPIALYAVLLLPRRFPRTENAEAGLPVGEMFKFTFTSPFFLLMLAMMAITTSLELGPMRWIPSVLQSGGMHGILVLVWISGWMAVLRGLSGHAIARFSPTGMLLGAATLTGTGLVLLSYAEGLGMALAAATVFAWGIAFFFPTMVGVVSERVPRTGSLGIVLTAGIGLGMSGAVGVPLMGKLADGYLAEALPVETTALLQRVDSQFTPALANATNGGAEPLSFRPGDVREALDRTRAALTLASSSGSIAHDETATALRAIVGSGFPDAGLLAEANGILQPAELAGGKRAFRTVSPAALLLILVFATMYLRDRRRGGYRAERLKVAALLVLAFGLSACATTPGTASGVAGGAARGPTAQAAARGAPAPNERLRVLFLGDNGHHQPSRRAKELTPVLAAQGIDLFYTDEVGDLRDDQLAQYHAVMLYNNHMTVSPPELASLMRFVERGGGLVVLHCASASFQNSEAFIKLVGASFKSHGTGTFSAVRVVTDHPAIRGVPAFETWDETYVHTRHNPVDRTVLEVRRDGGHDEPWTWVRTYGRGRVFYTASGHDQRTWGNVGFQKLVEQGTRWAMGDWALSHVARDPVYERMQLEVPLPTYRKDTVWNVLDTAVTKAQVALSTEESIRMMTLRPGFVATSFAVEPMIGNIIDFTWDARGRMWAVETNDYPNTVLPDSIPGGDRILIIDDTDGDGRADWLKVFAAGLNLATSLTFANGGLVVAQAPHMLFFKDTDGDDVSDERRVLFSGFPRGDTHGTVSNLRLGFDNLVWGSVGYNGFVGTVGPNTYPARDPMGMGAGYFRFPSDGSGLEYVARTGNNTWGVAFSEDGYVFGSTANSNPTNFVHIPARYYRSMGVREPTLRDIADRVDVYPNREILQVDQFGRYTAGTAHEIYSARAFPKEYWNRVAFVAEPTAHLVGMFELRSRGSAFRATNRWSLMASRDEWAAPVQVKVGPDGAVWVADFYTLVAQHNPTPRRLMAPNEKYPQGCCENGPGNAYVTPNRDRLHGRVYRIAYGSGEPAPRRRLDNATPAQLVAALGDDNMFWRSTAQRLLVERKQRDVVPALIALVRDQRVDELGLDPSALHALWTLQGLGTLRDDDAARTAVQEALHHPAGSVRRAALQALPRDQRLLDGILAAAMLPERDSPSSVSYTVPSVLLQDADAHVRLEALLTLSELPSSPRVAAMAAEALFVPENAGDPWIPDGVAIATSSMGPEFVRDLATRRITSPDTLVHHGVRRTVQALARRQGATADASVAAMLIGAVPQANPIVAVGVVDGLAQGWPEERPPQFTDAQRTALRTAAANAPDALAAAFTRLATRWTLPTVFSAP